MATQHSIASQAFRIEEGTRENTSLRISIAGESGSGKTMSALMLAQGICNGSKPLVIDSEARKARHYGNRFAFDHIDFEPPCTPERFLEAVKTGVDAGYEAIITDSISDEWEGLGGMLDMRDAISIKGPGGWKEPKKRHRKMVQYFKQCRTNLIFCARADEERLDMSTKDDRGKLRVLKRHWIPVVEKRWSYDMVISLILLPDAPGVVNLTLPHRLPDDFRTMLVHGRHIDAEAGEQMGLWARGMPSDGPNIELWKNARNASHEGTVAIKAFMAERTEEEKKALSPIRRELWITSKRADELRDEQPF